MDSFGGLFDNIQTPVSSPIPNTDAQQQQQVIEGVRIPKNQQVQTQNQQETQTQPLTQLQTQLPQPQTQLPQQQTAGDDMSIIYSLKEFYTEKEWHDKYQAYTNECGKINNVDPTRLNASDIAIMATNIDRILTPARTDHANVKSFAYKYENMLKVAQEIVFKDVIDDAVAKGNKKPTIDETKAMVTKEIQGRTIYENNKDLFSLKIMYNERLIQIQSILDTLQDKKDLLIIYSASLKVESSLNSFIPNVPTNQQMNQMGM